MFYPDDKNFHNPLQLEILIKLSTTIQSCGLSQVTIVDQYSL